jgi:phosphonatase-like hydrolase
MSRVTVACLDMAGTTVRDDGTVMAAFEAAVGDADPEALAYVRATMGQSKIEEVLRACRSAGVKVCLATGFSPATRDAILDSLGWRSLTDLVLSPSDAGRGRPWPDIPLTALLRLGGGSVSELAVVGDTPSDVESGLRAGAGLVAGVLTGTGTRADFQSAGAPVILDSIAGLLSYLP